MSPALSHACPIYPASCPVAAFRFNQSAAEAWFTHEWSNAALESEDIGTIVIGILLLAASVVVLLKVTLTLTMTPTLSLSLSLAPALRLSLALALALTLTFSRASPSSSRPSSWSAAWAR